MIQNETSGGEALVRMLLAHDVGPMFGMGGFQLLPFYDAARRFGLNHHLINDERCAVFAADAYAKASRRVGLADATLGPGATNLVTGLVEALNAGSPLVVLVGDAHRTHAGKNMTQETDQISILKPACKELLNLETVERIPEIIRRAFYVAMSGRPGPVVVNVPEDIAHGTYNFKDDAFEINHFQNTVPALRCRPDSVSTREAAEILCNAKRPLMLCGGGVHISGAQMAVTKLAENFGIPVAHTLTGKGSIACTSPLNAGLFGRYDRIANGLIEDSDCLFVVGCKLGEIATKRYTIPGAGKFLIHLDIVAEEMGRTYAPFIKLWGDAKAGIEDLLDCLRDSASFELKDRVNYLKEVTDKMEGWKRGVSKRLYSNESPVHMARLITELNHLLPSDGCLVADGGFAAHWAGLLFDTKKIGRSFIPDRGFASIGYGVPGAIGTQLAIPDATVVGLTGDGGFNMTMGEIETARRMELGINVIVVNNAASGYVKALQHAMYGEGAYQSSDLSETNYAEVARALGCHGIRVEAPDLIKPALEESFSKKNIPSLIDVIVTRNPAEMLPAVDNRATVIQKGDRIA